MAKKFFVLDTNVILHDHTCIYSFEDNDLVLPITVLEELDKFKKGNDQINFNARFFTRELDQLTTGEDIFQHGVSLGKKMGKLSIDLGLDIPNGFRDIFHEDKPDNHILGVAYKLTRKYKTRSVVLVTKDINLRMKARSLGIVAEDYETDKIDSLEALFPGKTLMEEFPAELIQRLYQEPYHLSLEDMPKGFPKPVNNQYYIFRNGSLSALAWYNPFQIRIERLESKDAYGIKPRNAEQTFSLHILMNPEIKLATIIGKAGTGKTLIALASALAQFKDYKQIFLARPIVPLSNKDIGFLPGDIQSKIHPYMEPLYDNLKFIQHQFHETDEHFQRIDRALESEKLCISPLAYIRGRSLNKIFFIVDEAQNLTPHEVKTIITRAGEGTKIVFTGDPYQIDTPYLDSESNGLSTLVSKMTGQKIYANVRMEKGERSELADLASTIL